MVIIIVLEVLLKELHKDLLEESGKIKDSDELPIVLFENLKDSEMYPLIPRELWDGYTMLANSQSNTKLQAKPWNMH